MFGKINRLKVKWLSGILCFLMMLVGEVVSVLNMRLRCLIFWDVVFFF